jgi:hypothetical protein
LAEHRSSQRGKAKPPTGEDRNAEHECEDAEDAHRSDEVELLLSSGVITRGHQPGSSITVLDHRTGFSC